MNIVNAFMAPIISSNMPFTLWKDNLTSQAAFLLSDSKELLFCLFVFERLDDELHVLIKYSFEIAACVFQFLAPGKLPEFKSSHKFL